LPRYELKRLGVARVDAPAADRGQLARSSLTRPWWDPGFGEVTRDRKSSALLGSSAFENKILGVLQLSLCVGKALLCQADEPVRVLD